MAAGLHVFEEKKIWSEEIWERHSCIWYYVSYSHV